MHNLPINSLKEIIKESDISIKKGYVYIQYQNKEYCMNNLYIDEINNKPDRQKIIHYLLTSEYSGAKYLEIKDEYCEIKMDSAFDTIKINNDPKHGESFNILLYTSLQSINWHLICHVIADHWIRPDKPCLPEKILNNQVAEVWTDFQKKVECERWGKFNLTDQKLIHKYKTKWKNESYKRCFNCINDYGVDQFLKCCRFLEPYKSRYISYIHKCVSNTIKNELDAYNKPLRRHLHIANNDRATNDIYAYIIEMINSKKYYVYLIIFQKIKGKDNDLYKIKTIFGKYIRKSWEKAEQAVFDHLKNKKDSDLEVEHYCHKDNWGIVQYMKDMEGKL